MSLIHKVLLLLVAAAGALIGSGPAFAADQPRVLLYSGSTGYRHASIEAGVAAIKALAAREGMTIVASEDPEVFSTDGLKDVGAIIFLSTSTDPKKPETEWFTGERREALQAFVRRGGGIVGIHAASDSHYHWPWFGQLMGGRFVKHPQGTPEGTVVIAEASHPSTAGLPAETRRVDEWYYFDDYDPTSTLLVALDPASIGEKDVNPNPVSWAREFDGGRVFYTAMGHTAEAYSEPYFLQHLAGGLRWVLKR